MAAWDGLSTPKNGDRKNGKVYFNGQWIPETDPLLKPKVYNNNVGVPIEKEIVDKYKEEPSTFMDRFQARDAKGNSAMSTLGDTLIAIGSKGWGNAGLGDGAKVFSTGMSTMDSNMVQTAAKDEALKVFNDPKATPQMKMDAVLKAKDAGVDTKDFDTMLNSINGMKQPEGNIIDPLTGKITTVLAPTDTMEYKQGEKDMDTKATIEINDAAVRQALAKEKGMTDEQLREWSVKNPVEFAQDMAKQEASLKQQGANADASAAKQDAKDANTATRDEAKAKLNDSIKGLKEAEENVNAGKAALTAMDELETLVASQTDDMWKNLANLAATMKLPTTDVTASDIAANPAYDLKTQIDQMVTPLAISFHPGGVMTDADLIAYKSIMVNPLASRSAQLANIQRQEAAFVTKLENEGKRKETLENQKREAEALYANAGSKQAGTTSTATTTSTGSSGTAFKPPAIR